MSGLVSPTLEADAPVVIPTTAPRPTAPPAQPAKNWRKLQGRRDKNELRTYWDTTARTFRSFTEAPSTQYYFRHEKRLFETYFGDLRGQRLLKLDLWNEVHNTQILRWAARHAGAEVYAIDIADFTVETATQNFRDQGLSPRFAIADVREIPFRDESFDCLYTMGTIEHFEKWEHVIGEIYRVLKPGGTAIVGVPNKRDPFLRPLLVEMLDAFFHYPYGFEMSFSFAELEAACRRQGFRVDSRDGLLFYPSVLRMADLFCYIRTRMLVPVFSATVWPFDTLCRLFPQLNQHGYLIATVLKKD